MRRRLRPAAVPVRPPRPAACRSPATSPGGAVDLSIGTPIDPAPPAVVAALSASGSERGYPPSIGTPELREAIVDWMRRRFDVDGPTPPTSAACVGTKEFVGTLPQWLRLRSPDRDTVLYPAVAYPTYEMGAILAGCRPVRGAADRARSARPRRDRRRRRRAGAGAVGQQPGQPHRGARRPRRGGGVGSRPRRAGVLRRVLRRVHVERAAAARSSSTDSTASSPCTRCRSARTSPGPGSASTPATPSWCTTSRRCASTSG